MTDRHAAYIVTLAEDVREGDTESIITALRMVKGILSVEPVVSDHMIAIARQRVDAQWREKLLEVIREGTS